MTAEKTRVYLETNHVRMISKTVSRTALQRVTKIGELLSRAAVQRLESASQSGRRYRVPGSDSYYTASAPGESPAVVTQELLESIKYTVGEGKWTRVRVGPTSVQGIMTERGTSDMAPRPWLRPACEENLREIERILSRRWL